MANDKTCLPGGLFDDLDPFICKTLQLINQLVDLVVGGVDLALDSGILMRDLRSCQLIFPGERSTRAAICFRAYFMTGFD
jgi:hypothetical protein